MANQKNNYQIFANSIRVSEHEGMHSKDKNKKELHLNKRLQHNARD